MKKYGVFIVFWLLAGFVFSAYVGTLPEVMSRYHWAEIEQDTSVSSKTQNA